MDELNWNKMKALNFWTLRNERVKVLLLIGQQNGLLLCI